MARANDIPDLNCEASAAAGARLALLARLEEMCARRAAALNWADLEGVHDMRVASRRLRSALRDFAPFFRKAELRPIRARIKLIAGALGRVRDEDVAIAALERLMAKAPADLLPGLERVVAERRIQREELRSRLVAAIAEEQLARLQLDVAAGLEHSIRDERQPGRSGLDQTPILEPSFRQAGRDIIAARIKDLRKLSRSLYAPLRTGPLHRLRIAAKRLRYALELFAPCWGGALVPYAREVAELQSSLGDLHDADEWIKALGKRLRRTSRRQEAADTRSAAGEDQRALVWLLDHFSRARTKHYRASLRRWQEWQANHLLERLAAQLEAGDLAPGPQPELLTVAGTEPTGAASLRDVS